jgi:UDP-N-acetylmuramoyl-L-alanyl-D-glutamate--2,6-diaminopimelate ligase
MLNYRKRKVESVLRLSELINGDRAASDPALAVLAASGALDLDIRGVTSDSRAVRPGFLFAALPGSATDGRRFISDAVARGAVAVLTRNGTEALDVSDDSGAPDNGYQGVPLIHDANPRRRLARIAARFYGVQPAVVAAVTGTNGKTSVAEFARQLWAGTGAKSASLGTLGLVTGEGRPKPGLTTPDPVALHASLRDLANDGVTRLAIEASSHGLDQCRLDGVRVRAAAFTNLSQDHLDYHRTMGAYRAVKLRLFSDLLDGDGTAVLNIDAPEYARIAEICRDRGVTVMSYGQAKAADLRIVRCAPTAAGQDLTLRVFGRERSVFLPLVGDFQAMNAVAALGLVLASEGLGGAGVGDDGDYAGSAYLDGLAALRGAPGRLEHVGNHPTGAAVFVDFAHTPDALRAMLSALRPHVAGRLTCVFGAGGDRDSGKRVLMGQAVARGADAAIVTDDNPRSEDPARIRRAVLLGCPRGREFGDREAAIIAGLADLKAGDVLVIAGKGHEPGQTIGDRVLPFDDAKVALRALRDSGGDGL